MELLIEKLRARRGSFEIYVETLEVNSTVVVVGRNGSGKSTMLDAVAGLLKAEGSVHACGRDVSRLPTEKRGLAYVQSVPIDPPSAVGAFLREVAKRHGTLSKIDQVVDMLGVRDLLQRRGGLSTGQRQLVNLAAALLSNPCAFLMDEPTSHLDWVNKKSFNDIVKKLNHPVLYVTHDPFEAIYIADVICVMKKGRLERCFKNEGGEIEKAYRHVEKLIAEL
ncbi:MAG: ATP-binding cassette domain-containing protein [Pyrobaculum sp.]